MQIADCTACVQIHYMGKRPDKDESGVRLSLTRQPQPLAAGMVHFASWFSIPARQPSHHIDNRCCYNGFEPAEGFAFRVHTHMLGRYPQLHLYPWPHKCTCLSVVNIWGHWLQGAGLSTSFGKLFKKSGERERQREKVFQISSTCRVSVASQILSLCQPQNSRSQSISRKSWVSAQHGCLVTCS